MAAKSPIDLAELTIEDVHLRDTVEAIIHTILYVRAYNSIIPEMSTVVDNDSKFPYVRCANKALQDRVLSVAEEITKGVRGFAQTQPRDAPVVCKLSISFFGKHLTAGMFSRSEDVAQDSTAFEAWTLPLTITKTDLRTPASERNDLFYGKLTPLFMDIYLRSVPTADKAAQLLLVTDKKNVHYFSYAPLVELYIAGQESGSLLRLFGAGPRAAVSSKLDM